MSASTELAAGPAKGRLTQLGLGRARGGHSRRRTRIVRLLRVAFPALASAVLAAAIAWPYLGAEIVRLAEFLPRAIDQAARDYQIFELTMKGVDDQSRPYVFTAETAIKFDPDLEEISLNAPNADLTLDDGAWLALMAERGFYRPKEKVLLMHDGVNLFHDSGYELSTSVASIDLSEGSAEGDQPVDIQGSFGVIHAEGFRITDDANRVFLVGPARARIYPDAKDPE